MPEVDNLATCFVDDGVSSGATDEALAVLALALFLLLIVTLGGM